MDGLEKLFENVPAKKALTLVDQFKTFAFKGNVIDLAVGVIIGASFGKIVDSLVKNILMPLIAVVAPGKKGYLAWSVTIRGSEIQYGQFLGELVNFLIVSLALFLFIVKFLGWLTRSKAAAPPPPPTKEEILLTEIRDAIRAQGTKSVSGP